MYQSSYCMWRCAPLVTQVLKSELQRQGVTVNNHICEHLPTHVKSCITWYGLMKSKPLMT